MENNLKGSSMNMNVSGWIGLENRLAYGVLSEPYGVCAFHGPYETPSNPCPRCEARRATGEINRETTAVRPGDGDIPL